MKSRVHFADAKLKLAFERLRESKAEEQVLFKWIDKAIDDLEGNAFCGIQIPKKLIPRVFIKNYSIDNLWKYDLPRGWMLIYSVSRDEVQIITIILEWMSHKNYEKRFNY